MVGSFDLPAAACTGVEKCSEVKENVRQSTSGCVLRQAALVNRIQRCAPDAAGSGESNEPRISPNDTRQGCVKWINKKKIKRNKGFIAPRFMQMNSLRTPFSKCLLG